MKQNIWMVKPAASLMRQTARKAVHVSRVGVWWCDLIDPKNLTVGQGRSFGADDCAPPAVLAPRRLARAWHAPLEADCRDFAVQRNHFFIFARAPPRASSHFLFSFSQPPPHQPPTTKPPNGFRPCYPLRGRRSRRVQGEAAVGRGAGGAVAGRPAFAGFFRVFARLGASPPFCDRPPRAAPQPPRSTAWRRCCRRVGGKWGPRRAAHGAWRGGRRAGRTIGGNCHPPVAPSPARHRAPLPPPTGRADRPARV